MAKNRLQLPLEKGLWTRKNALAQPPGSLQYARNAILPESGGIERRLGRTDYGSVSDTLHGITQFETIDGTTDKVVVHAGSTISAGDTGDTAVTFSALDIGIADAGPTTFSFYNDTLYVSNGEDIPRVIKSDGSTTRVMGIPSDTSMEMTVSTAAGTGLTVVNGRHFTYRYYDSTNNLWSDPPVASNGDLLYTSVDAGTYDAYVFANYPTSAPLNTQVNQVVIMMTLDETSPSTFYPVRFITLGTESASVVSSETLQPDSQARVGTNWQFSNPANAYDSSLDSYASIRQSADEDFSNATVGSTWSFSVSSTKDWRLEVAWSRAVPSDQFTDDLDADTQVYQSGFTFTIDYTDDAWVTTQSLISRSETWTTDGTRPSDIAQTTTTATDELTATDSTDIQVRAKIVRTDTGVGYSSTYKIHDIRVVSTDTAIETGFTANETMDVTGDEANWVGASNIGQFQPPPSRLFPTNFEGHLLGKSDDNGLFLAYGRTDSPEYWSTDPRKAAFPYLIPFKEREADDITGAEKVANQLVVFATDSVWRINHLPVLSDPNASTEELFTEARSTVKRRVTDTVGCVGVKAYCRVQLSSDEDFVFFWSQLGPMLTDGFRVWRVADHVDWSHLNDDQSKCVVTNYTSERRIEVDVRSSDATKNDCYYVFHYYPSGLITEGGGHMQGAIRFSVTGPCDGAFADRTEFRKSTNAKGLLACANAASGDEQGQVYLAYNGTTDADTGAAAEFKWITGRIGASGLEQAFDKMLINVQEDGQRTFTAGDTDYKPSLPVDKDPLDINASGQSLEVVWEDDEVSFFVLADDEEDGRAVSAPETVSFTRATRTINTATLFYDDGEEVKD